MGEKLYSGSYKEFIRGIDKSEFTIKDIIQHTKKAVPGIAGELHLGRVETILKAKPNLIDRVGFDGQELLFQSEKGYDPELHTLEFTTGGGAYIKMNAYPEAGYKWSELELDDLRFICSNYFSLFERARLSSIIEKAAVTESMTGAVNIAGLLQILGKYKSNGTLGRYTSAFMNIKDFKFLNKRLGIKQGDAVLRGFVDKLYGYLTPDEVVARLGGDNFVVLVSDERLGGFLDLVTPLVLTSVDKDKTKELNVFFRIGLCNVTQDTEISDVLGFASTALAETRKPGNGDIIWFDKNIHEQHMAIQKATFLFGEALVNDEFQVFYQPKVRLEDNALCGSEALVRWIRHGKVHLPMEFIPALEEDGSITELDFVIFEKVCRDIRMWLDAEIEPVKVSVNFSKHHIKTKEAALNIIGILNRYAIDPKYIEVELTESACYEDMAKIREFLETLSKHNISVSIDDFGTGYSSLSLLKNLMVDIIKLDQSFVRAIDGEDETEVKNDMVVIKNIVNMVKELNMDIIAEGVETLEEAGFLREVNCNMAQGYLFDKPMPHDDFELLLKGNRVFN